MIGKAISRLRLNRARLRSAWLRQRFCWVEKWTHQRLYVGPQTVFQVPVRSGGQGSLTIGCGNSFGYWPAPRLGSGEILLQPRAVSAVIQIGDGNMFSNNVCILANHKITIGSRCQIGDQVAIYDCDFHEICPSTRNRSAGPAAPVCIGNNVWLGSRVMVLKGVTIGDNSVVAAMSVVTRAIPPNCLVAGVPAEVVRSIG